jgi:hypothetical protein
LVVRSKVWPTSTTKDAKRCIVWRFVEKTFHGCFIIYDFARQHVNEIGSGQECFIPKFEWHGCISKKSKAYFYNVAMLAFCGSILLMSMGA